LPFPPRLCAADGGFTAATFAERIPAILEETLSSNPGMPPAFAAAVRAELVAPLRGGAALPPPPPPVASGAEEGVDWEGEPLWDPRFAERNPLAAASFWWQENAVYRHLLRLYFAHGGAGDPFSAQKAQALEAAEAPFCATVAPLVAAAPPDAALLRALLHRSLWGNRADLSLSGGKVVPVEVGGAAAAAAAAELLCDDTAAACALLLAAAASGRTVGVLLDNVGLELLSDLALVDALLSLGATVVLHAKLWPTFVSDATRDDVAGHIAWLRAPSPLLGGRLAAAVSAGALRVVAHPFFNSGRASWEMPAPLREEMAGWALAVSKGDANYRRLLGDRHWPHGAPFQEVVGGYAPCALLALRTCKAGLVVGLPPEREREAAAMRPGDWLTCGVFGVAQLATP
jgi:uncharacterized protein with ATP-grasp and redox domains